MAKLSFKSEDKNVTRRDEIADSSATDTQNDYSHRYCNTRPTQRREFDPEVNADRANAINIFGDKWVNGTELSYYFFDKQTDGSLVTLADGSTEFISWVGNFDRMNIVRRAFERWKSLGIGLKFTEVASREQAMVRIGFMQGDGAWSYVGRAILDIAIDQRTMNFGWDITNDLDTALHEIGHTLGFEHEHQNPFSGIVWDEEKVYSELAKAPNKWTQEKTFFNIIRKLDEAQIRGTQWDPDSVMHYPFQAGLIKSPPRYLTQRLQPAGGLSTRDISYVTQLYPKLGTAVSFPELLLMKSAPLALTLGQQIDLRLRPNRTRDYEFKTFGKADTVMVLFEEENGDMKYRAADDDSGEDRNAYFKLRLIRDQSYVLRVRLYYADRADECAVLWW